MHTNSLLKYEVSSRTVFFISYKDRSHIRKQQLALDRLRISVAKQQRKKFQYDEAIIRENTNDALRSHMHNPDISGMSPYKIHISLAEESYTPELIGVIKNILFKYLHIVSSFKYVDMKQLSGQRKRVEEYLIVLKEMRGKASYSQIDRANFSVIFNLFHQSYRSRCNTPTQDEFKDLFPFVEEELSHLNRYMVRFSKSDQFTLYLPSEVDHQELLRLCQEIKEILLNLNAIPGECSKAALPVGNYLNFRQEYTLANYSELKRYPVCHRFIRTSAGEEDSNRIKVVHTEMKACIIFKYLLQNLSTTIPANPWQVSWDEAKGDDFNKAIVLLLKYSCTYLEGSAVKGGKFGRLFQGKWNTHQGDAVKAALIACYGLDATDRTLETLLNELERALASNVKLDEINRSGAFRKILAVIRANTELNFSLQILRKSILDN